jgi:2-amino-4-hydroxy-6-hydroxymethyldihydropteridine diphosphokinase
MSKWWWSAGESVSDWAFVALGSNLDDRAGHLAAGRAGLAALPGTRMVAESTVEETPPLGAVPQGPYLNQMVLLSTALEPRDLLERCRAIEQAQGRVRRERWGPRTLDLDIVRYGERKVAEPDLVLPHPELPNRPFWQRELTELLPYAR